VKRILNIFRKSGLWRCQLKW